MFAVRCMGVSLAFFLVLYCIFSVAVLRAWRFVQRAVRWLCLRHQADLLFALRGFPLAAAALLTLAFVLPSFLLLEPRVSAEPVGEIPLTLGVCCLVLFAMGAFNAGTAYVRTSRTVAGWLAEATVMPCREPVPVFRIRPTVPSLTVAGVCAPRVLLSDAAAAMLGPQELEAAFRHELAHVQRWDNLKKLLFHFCAFPGMSCLELAWADREELAADDAAVTCANDALDLASALIKLSRLAPVHPSAALATALIQNPAASVNARVERLVAWETHTESCSPPTPWYAKAVGLGTVVGVMGTYGAALRDMHTLTEWLVR
jgi:Zn-dependent protease with chaperone function